MRLPRSGFLFAFAFVAMIGVGTRAVVPSETSSESRSEFPMNKIERGMECYGLTTNEGVVPVKIPLKILDDVDYPVFSSARLILAEMEDNLPVASGMSGSPIYCDGKLLGALSWRLGDFPVKAPLAGITPISHMRDQKRTLGKSVQGQMQSVGNFHPLPIPLSVNGSPISTVGDLGALSRKNILGAGTIHIGEVAGAPTPARPRAEALVPLVPGDMITVLLSRGAVKLGASCTVTEVTEKTFSACGHSLFGEGQIELPAFKSAVATTFWSERESYKLPGDIIGPAGTIVYDNAFAVEGVREMRPSAMVPVRLSVAVNDDQFTYDFEVFRHKFYTSRLVEIGTLGLISNLWSENKIGTAKFGAKIFLKGKVEPIEIFDASLIARERASLGFLEGYTNPWDILADFQEKFSALQSSEWNFAIDRVEIDLRIWEGNHTLMFDSMAVLDKEGNPTDEIRPGDTVSVLIGMRNQDSTQKIVKKFEMEVPKDLRVVRPNNTSVLTLPADLVIMSGGEYTELDPKKIPKHEPDSPEEFLEMLQLDERNPGEMFAVLVLPPEYRALEDGIPKALKTPQNLKNNAWNTVGDLEFLRERKDASEERIVFIPLGVPVEDAVISFSGRRQLKLILK